MSTERLLVRGIALRCVSCGPALTTSDRARHKQYCTTAQPGITVKDGLFAGIRHLLACPLLLEYLKCYAALVLDLANNTHAGLAQEVLVTCTTMPNAVAGSGRIFQLARVVLNANPLMLPNDVFDSAMTAAGARTPQTPCRLVFKSDVPGTGWYLQSIQFIEPNLLPISQTHRDDPIAWVLCVHLPRVYCCRRSD